MISFVVAMDENNVIGADKDLPWPSLPKDMQSFKDTTMNGTMFMGRKTYEAIGRPLPKRKSIVLTRGKDTFPEEVEVARDMSYVKEYADKHPDEELYVIGGGVVFKETMPIADRLYVTHIHASFKGDTVFPEIDEKDWELTSETYIEPDENNEVPMTFAVYNRKK